MKPPYNAYLECPLVDPSVPGRDQTSCRVEDQRMKLQDSLLTEWYPGHLPRNDSSPIQPEKKVSGEYRIQTHSILPLIIPPHFHTAHSLPCSRFLGCHEKLRDIPKNRGEGNYTAHSAPCLPSKLCMRIVLGDTKCIMSNMKVANTEVSNGHLRNTGKWIKRCFSAPSLSISLTLSLLRMAGEKVFKEIQFFVFVKL